MAKKIEKINENKVSLKLFGYDKYFNDFFNLYDKSKFPKVSLLSGDKGLGKYTFIFHLINCFLSTKDRNPYNLSDKRINEDNQIYKQIISNVSQNFFYVSNENNSKANIEDIRNLKNLLNNSTLNNTPRFIIFDDVEFLNINSANSLLKLIEEPSSTNFFILINNNRRKVLETIKSRSIETKIFLNKTQKKIILSKLISHFNIDEHYSHQYFSYTTPGLLIEFSKILNENQIEINTSFYEMASTFLDKYKKNKNEVYLECIKFFLEIKSKDIYNKSKNDLFIAINEKNDLMKILYNYKIFNLTNAAILDYIKKSKNSLYV